MKLVQTFVSAVVSALILTLAAGAYAQSATKAGCATVVRIQGEARYSAGDNVWHPLVMGLVMRPGNVIQTAPNSTVDLVLGDRVVGLIAPHGARITPPNPVPPVALPIATAKAQPAQNAIRLQGDTVLAIDKLTIADTGVDAVSDTELDLRKGTIFGNVKKMSASSQYLIKTPNGIAGVRGTSFGMTVDPTTLAAIVQVLSGSMVVSQSINGQTIVETVNSGKALNALGQIITLSPQIIEDLQINTTFTVTFADGLITLANDQTVVYVSPTMVAKQAPPPDD
jgi:hypothetical protein